MSWHVLPMNDRDIEIFKNTTISAQVDLSVEMENSMDINVNTKKITEISKYTIILAIWLLSKGLKFANT